MIRIDRNRVDDAGRPIRPDDAWFELSRQWTQSALRERGDHDVKDHVYRHLSVKTALEELFHRKCAYCETPLGEVDWQVEHFRPKGAVTERPDHPGYYWLAYEWSNLYPSCAPCNQSRKDLPLWGDPETGEAAGKANQFPVEDETGRPMRHEDDIRREKPLLLDPCSDEPEKSFRYTPLGEILPVDGDLRAETSARVFHLTRRRLRDRRREQVDAVIVVLKLVQKLENQGNREEATELRRDVDRLFFSDSAPFAGAARFVRSDPDAFGV
ncbi:MAG TPA: retron system putative HNH endonuclease [Thermoanaerobaculia bacterium]|nr:retron system putative HNH endonuclease [Thermoanaerobaculia bacterium]